MSNAETSGWQRPPTVSRRELLVDGSDREFRGVVDDLVRFAGELQAIREAIARQMRVTPPQYNILMALAHTPDRTLTVSELAERLRVSVPFAVTQTRRLEQAGYLRKCADIEDRRRVHLRLTPQGTDAVAAAAPLQRRVNDVLFESFSGDDLKMLGRLTRELLASSPEAFAEARRRRRGGTPPTE